MPSADFFHRFMYALAEIHGSFSLAKTQAAVVRHGALLFDAYAAALMLFNPQGKNLILSEAFGLSQAYRKAKEKVSPRKSLGEMFTNEPVVVRDVATDPNIQFRDVTMAEGVKSITALRMAAGSALVGSLRLYFTNVREFSPDEMDAFKGFTRQAGLALKKAFYFASMQEAVSEIHRMHADDFKQSMQALLKTIAHYAHARGAALLLLNTKDNTLASLSAFGLSDEFVNKGPISVGFSLGEVPTRKPVIIACVARDERIQYKEAAAHEKVEAVLGLPLWVGGQIAGALRLYYPFEFEPDEDYVTWMEHLALQVGMAMEKNQALMQHKERANWLQDVLKDFDR